MTIQAKVSLFESKFVAELSDGRQVAQVDFRAMAYALHRAGVQAHDVQFEWSSGRCMITAGQQAALRAEMRRLACEFDGLSLAA